MVLARASGDKELEAYALPGSPENSDWGLEPLYGIGVELPDPFFFSKKKAVCFFLDLVFFESFSNDPPTTRPGARRWRVWCRRAGCFLIKSKVWSVSCSFFIFLDPFVVFSGELIVFLVPFSVFGACCLRCLSGAFGAPGSASRMVPPKTRL